MDPFPYVVAALTAVGLAGVFFGIHRAVETAAELRGHIGYLTRRVTISEGYQGALHAAVTALQATCERQDAALERQATELREQRRSLPPPLPLQLGTPVPISGVRTSDDWGDDARKTQLRPSQPPLPAFERPGYMSR